MTKNDEKVEVIQVQCLECKQTATMAANSVYGLYAGINYFCHDKDCEDKYAFKQ